VLEFDAYAGLRGWGDSQLLSWITVWINDPANAELVSEVASEIGVQKSGTLTGTGRGDFLFGNETDDRITGGNGNNYLFGLGGNDTLGTTAVLQGLVLLCFRLWPPVSLHRMTGAVF